MQIYCIQNTKNDKTYIGLDSYGNRLKQHQYLLKKQEHTNPYLQYSWNKNGEESFNFTVLEDGFTDYDELCEAEKFWIRSLKSMYYQHGYNLETGGKSHKCAEITKKRLSKAHNKPVAQYSLSGNFIKVYDSAQHASESIDTSAGNIKSTCLGKTKRADGYQWRHVDSGFKYTIEPVENNYHIRARKTSKCVAKYDLEGNLIDIFPSAIKAAENIDCHRANIRMACRGNWNTVKGYQWKYFDNELKDKIEPADDPFDRYRKRVGKFDMKGNLIEEYDSFAEAADDVGLAGTSGITLTCQGKQSHAAGFDWNYLN